MIDKFLHFCGILILAVIFATMFHVIYPLIEIDAGIAALALMLAGVAYGLGKLALGKLSRHTGGN